ncbi:MAG: DUF5123 domain-containing protein [Prevotella sp.]|nr:DUF5123 domain-containing protein [Prevotella sp.]
MMKNILKSLFVAVALVAGSTMAFAEEFVFTPQATVIWGNGDDSKDQAPNTNGDVNYYDASATTWNVSQSAVANGSFKNNNNGYGGSYILISKFDCAANLAGKTIQKATLKFTSVCTVSGKNSNVQAAYIGTGWDATTATWNTVNTAEIMNAVQFHEGTNVKTSPVDFNLDVTDIVSADEDKVLGFAVYTYTAREQKISNLSLVVEAIDASASADYTINFVTLEGEVVKTETVTESIGGEISLKDAFKEPFYNEDNSAKYIYVGDDAEGKTVAADGSTIVTVTVRVADKFKYSVVAVDEAGELLQTLNSGSNFEGESFKVPYNKYVLNNADNTLYASDATSKEYNKSITLSENEMQVKVTFKKTDITDVVYLQEAEDIWGLTKATNGNTGIRSSNSASAYAAEEDVEITGLSTGKYKLTAVICDATKNAGSTFSFAVAEDTIAKITATEVNWFAGTSEEFTVIGNDVQVKLLKGGNANQAVDLIYIQKTGIVPPTEVANIAALKDVQEGMEVKLALTDAVVNIWSGDVTAQSMASYVEDATGAIKFDISLSNMEWMRDSIAMNGYIYASYGKDYDGIPQLSVSDSTGVSKVDTVAAVPASKVMTVADASNETALSRYVKFEKVEFVKKVVDDWGTTECYLVQGSDTIMFFDKFSRFGWGAMPDFKSFDEVQGFISMYEGKFEFYPYGEYKANYTPAVVAENIAAAKAVESGTNVNLTLKDAKITAYVSSRWGAATAYIEDASGAIQIAGDVLSQFGVENDSTILNGNIYVKYVNEWGSIQLNPGDSIAYSKVEAKEGAVSPTTMAVKDIKAETNVARYVEIAFPSFKYDAENYFYYAAQNGDTIMVVDNFGWMSSNFADNEGNIILPDSVSSIRGIVMWDDWNGYSIVPTGIDEFVAPQDIVVNVTEGDIAAAVETAKAAVKKVGKITINLTEGAAYTVNSSIVAPAGVVINGNGATVDASALGAPFIALSKEPTAELINNYYRVDSVMISNVRVDSIKNSIFYDNGTQYCVVDFTIDNSILNLATTAVQNDALVSFKQGGAKDVNIKNSTVYGNGVANYFVRYNNSARLDRYGFDKNTEFQTMNYQNNTFYNVIKAGGQWGNYGGIGGQLYSKFDVQNNIWYNCGNEVIRRMAGGRFNGKNPMTFAKNTYFYNDVDNSAKEASYDNSGDILTSDPGFKDAANGDFTLDIASEQNINKTGDARWLVEIPTAIEGVNATIMNNGDIYTINGVKVRNAGDSLKGLAKGLYIINGKKLIVK